MYILTNKNNVIIEISSIYERDEKYRNIKVDNHNIAYAPDQQINVYEVESVDEGVCEQKYCYTEADGFYLNKKYREPEPSLAERMTLAEDAINSILGF